MRKYQYGSYDLLQKVPQQKVQCLKIITPLLRLSLKQSRMNSFTCVKYTIMVQRATKSYAMKLNSVGCSFVYSVRMNIESVFGRFLDKAPF